jgi:nucleotide-binding universal stress UspA family protein
MTKYKNILVAIDGSKESESALQKAIHMTKSNSATLHIVHVINREAYTEMDICKTVITNRTVHFAEKLLYKYKEIANEASITKLLTILEYGDPKSTIPKQISSTYNIDLIVCGATGLNKIERLFIGSVSKHIARHADCDVLIVRNNYTSIAN